MQIVPSEARCFRERGQSSLQAAQSHQRRRRPEVSRPCDFLHLAPNAPFGGPYCGLFIGQLLDCHRLSFGHRTTKSDQLAFIELVQEISLRQRDLVGHRHRRWHPTN